MSTQHPHNLSQKGSAAALAHHLRAGHVYRREDLTRLSSAVDRDLGKLVATGRLNKLAQGLYHVPKASRFGPLPPDDDQVVQSFLRGDRDFLLFSPSAYNTVGLGTTQLYNRTLVYNRKRHGVFKLGKREFDFRVKPRFPRQLTPEFLFVDLLNNLDDLAEDRDSVLDRARALWPTRVSPTLLQAVELYGNAATRKHIKVWMDELVPA
ncbi:hypothetical protein [Castellaniella sp.]|uniref:hypothetical protein n=1 Tax=Castellaniella sp. TaxID=1955812 RepID=UPI003A93335F